MRPGFAILTLIMAVAGCSPGVTAPTPRASAPTDSGGPSIPSGTGPASPSARAASASPSAAVTASGTGAPAPGDPGRVRVRLEPVVGGLVAPLLVTSAGDSSGRLFVLEQGGRIRIVRDGHLLDHPFLDVSDRITSGGERGLLGLAFHPGFGGAERRFYLDYTDRNGDTVVAEYRASEADPDLADPVSERILLHVDQPFPNHNGGWVAFGPDRDLYVGMGDGGSSGDPLGNGQRLDTLLGKLLRIDVDAAEDGRPYAIPSGNPFASRPNARPEIWAYGLRNPWRDSFDRATGDLWIGDVGQDRYEEVDRARAGTGAGADYGWNLMEGDHCYPSGEGCARPGLAMPVAEYGHDLGCAITGGYVYRGRAFPLLDGVYLFADYCSGRIWGLSSGGPDRQMAQQLADTGRQIVSFGEDESGEAYVTDLSGGEVLRVVATGL